MPMKDWHQREYIYYSLNNLYGNACHMVLVKQEYIHLIEEILNTWICGWVLRRSLTYLRLILFVWHNILLQLTKTNSEKYVSCFGIEDINSYMAFNSGNGNKNENGNDNGNKNEEIVIRMKTMFNWKDSDPRIRKVKKIKCGKITIMSLMQIIVINA